MLHKDGPLPGSAVTEHVQPDRTAAGIFLIHHHYPALNIIFQCLERVFVLYQVVLKLLHVYLQLTAFPVNACVGFDVVYKITRVSSSTFLKT